MASNKSIAHARSSFDQLKGKRDAIQERITKAKVEIKETERKSIAIGKAQILAQQVASDLQSKLCFQISTLTTLALKAVFPDPYDFVVRFEEKRGRTEALLLVSRDGNETDPYEATGGGVVDVVSFALRICMWELMPKRSRPVLILDEPFRYVSADLQPKVGLMLKLISEKLGLQMLIVTHEKELMNHADKVFVCQRRNRRSEITGDDRASEAKEEQE